MTDEFYRCGNCRTLEPGVTIFYNIKYKDMENEEKALEVLGLLNANYELTECQLMNLDEAGIEYEVVEEVQICNECNDPYVAVFAGSTEKDYE